MASIFQMLQPNQLSNNVIGKETRTNSNGMQQIFSSSNPQQAAMSMLQQQNPQMANYIQQAMLSGKSPNAVMQDLGIDANMIAKVKSSFGR